MATVPKAGVGDMLVGLSLLARGRSEGLSRFDASVQGFLASLTPWLAFVLVDGLVAVVAGRPLEGSTDIVVLLCLLLAPPVISQGLATIWHRDERWLSYATASTWCEWLMPAALIVAWLVASILVNLGVPARIAVVILAGSVMAYWTWLHFFLARSALAVSPVRACVLVASLMAGNVALIGIAYGIGGQARAMLGG
jgi:hypothetical protein